MEDIFIIGAGGHARTVGSILKLNKKINIVGFVDKYKKEEDEKITGKNIIRVDSIVKYIVKHNIKKLVLAIGDNKKREYYFSLLKKKGYEFVNVIHPTAIVDESCRLGEGIMVGAGVILGAEVVINDNSIINNGVIVDHESIIGSNVHISPGTSIAGRVIVGDNSFVGIGTTIIDNIKIGKEVIIGAGSVVINNLSDKVKVAGAPALSI
ncbi:acetyltransferase [Halocella sp. SP3-1]|uniref:acetyltransferase n=1 Tax=Halocella sp. SP3-1 TaxID=2382161 RepID=UPI000F751BFD|nr:acetyltransferase [Halocella sp. SP3-1]AZO94016.1 acetyltransferase [Halocella sp. SP3-1]